MRTAVTAALALALLATLACRSPEDRKAEFKAQADSYFDNAQWSEAKIHSPFFQFTQSGLTQKSHDQQYSISAFTASLE